MTKQLPTIINVLSAIWLVSLAAASGQTPPGKPVETEPLEKFWADAESPSHTWP